MMSWGFATPGLGLPFVHVVGGLLLAFVLGQAIAWLYIITHRGLTWSRNMIHAIIMLAMIVSMVMQVVGDSIARAFGLVGALAIIRFRTVVRDARDTTFIFLSLAVGIAVGAGQPLLGVAGTVVVGLITLVLHHTGFGARYADAGVLRVRTSQPLTRLETLIGEWCTEARLLRQKPAGETEIEYSFDVRLYDPESRSALEAAVRDLGASVVALTIEESAEEW